MRVPISEIFHSIQGEGRNTGKSSVFMRFWGCNLHCSWCDTKYSWDPTVETATMTPFEDVIKQIQAFDCSHIIFTGGEPSLFQKTMNEMQIELKQSRGGQTYTFELETNGSHEIQFGYFNQINISPKLANSGNDPYEIKAFKTDSKFYGNMDLKFVVSNMEDLKMTEDFIQEHKAVILEKKIGIYLMPLGRDPESQMNKIVMSHAMKKGYNFCPRSHLIWFGDGKGR